MIIQISNNFYKADGDLTKTPMKKETNARKAIGEIAKKAYPVPNIQSMETSQQLLLVKLTQRLNISTFNTQFYQKASQTFVSKMNAWNTYNTYTQLNQQMKSIVILDKSNMPQIKEEMQNRSVSLKKSLI